MTLPLRFPNVLRLITHIITAFDIGYLQMGQKEKRLYSQIDALSSANEFLQAVKAGDVSLCQKMLRRNPGYVRARLNNGRKEGAVHIAAENNDMEMVKLLRR